MKIDLIKWQTFCKLDGLSIGYHPIEVEFYLPYNSGQNIKRIFAEAVAQRWSVKKLFLKILQYLQESTCAGVSFKYSCSP